MFGKRVITAVDIDPVEIKIAVLLSSRRRGAVCRLLHRHPGPGVELWDNGGVHELAGVLKRAIQSAPGAGKNAISVIGGQKVILRQMRLPKMPMKELDRAIIWEAEKLLPLPVEELVIRPLVLRQKSDGEGNQLHILLAAAQKDAVYRHYNIFSQAGLKITAIDLQHLALWRVFHGSFGYPAHDNGVRAVLNVDYFSGQFIVLKGRELLYVRSLPVEAGRLLAAGVLKTAPAENTPLLWGVEALDKEAAVSTEAPPGLPNAYDGTQFEHLADLVREVRRSLDFYQLQERDNQVTNLVLTGAFSKIAKLAGFLADQLGIKVEAGFPLLACKDKKQPPQAIDPVFSVAAGLALREVLR